MDFFPLRPSFSPSATPPLSPPPPLKRHHIDKLKGRKYNYIICCEIIHSHSYFIFHATALRECVFYVSVTLYLYFWVPL